MRSTNFTKCEEEKLVLLVKKYLSIIECKISDTNANKKKIECWTEIEKEFNTNNEVFRNCQVLRKKYENLKKRTKKKFADEKLYITGTGGGPPNHTEVTSVDNEIRDILGARLEGMTSEFDDDTYITEHSDNNIDNSKNSITKKRQQNNAFFEFPEFDVSPMEKSVELDERNAPSTSKSNVENERIENGKQNEICNEIGQWQQLRNKKSKNLIAKRAENSLSTGEINKKITQWADAKNCLENAKKLYLEEEHKLKLKHMQEKHDEEIKIMKEKAAQEILMKKEEHKIKMEILKLEKQKIINLDVI